ncbi:MAG: zinc-binding alcohol dehydrogenase family protein, partial [Proteobacteria bacterium]
MKAAVIRTFGEAPRYEEFPEPEVLPGEELVSMRAVGVHQLVRALARGTHYGSDGTLPMVPGVDGVGITAEGQRIYCGMLRAPFGTLAERAATRVRIPVPDGMSDARCAAIGNPGLSGWLALVVRAELEPGETVLVLGATGASGSLAVQIAKRLGAGRVIAAGRDVATLERLLGAGADAVVRLDGPDVAGAIAEAAGTGGVQVIVDYVWGVSTEAALTAVTARGFGRATNRVRLVQVGETAASTVQLPAAALRSTDLV